MRLLDQGLRLAIIHSTGDTDMKMKSIIKALIKAGAVINFEMMELGLAKSGFLSTFGLMI